jgi:hypothetical protein
VRLNGASTHNLVENLVQKILKLSEDVQQLRKDIEYLKYHSNKITTSVPTSSVRARKPSAQGSITLPDDVPPPSAAASADCSVSAGARADAGSKSYKDVLSTGLKPRVAVVESEGFTTVIVIEIRLPP